MHELSNKLSVMVCCWSGVILGAVSLSAAAADTAAGKSLAEQRLCATCHLPDDWKGNSAAQMESKITAVVEGKHKHPKKIDLSKDQIADIAAYWSAGSP